MKVIDAIARLDVVRRSFLKNRQMNLSDLRTLGTLESIKDGFELCTPARLIAAVAMNRNWVYASLRKLQKRRLVIITSRKKGGSLLSISGDGKLFLRRAQEHFEPGPSFIATDSDVDLP